MQHILFTLIARGVFLLLILSGCATDAPLVQTEDTKNTSLLHQHIIKAPPSLDPLDEYEWCDYVDNDHDGLTDEDWSELYPNFFGRICSVTGANQCENFGIWTCSADGAGLFCNAPMRIPTTEKCNGADDDCNGIADTDRWPELGVGCEIELEGCTVYGVWRCDDYTEDVYCTAEDDRDTLAACIPRTP